MGKSVYMQLKEKSLPHIKAYKEDLTVHDRKFLRENPGLPFLHFTGKTGTHLFALREESEYPKEGERVKYIFGWETREGILESEFSVIPDMKTRYGRGDLAMYFDGKKLKKISYEDATKIGKDYVESMLRKWRNKGGKK